MPSRALSGHEAPSGLGSDAPAAEAGVVSRPFAPLHCDSVTKVVREALDALRALDGRRAEALLVELLDDLDRVG